MADEQGRTSSSEELLRRANESITSGSDSGYDATFAPSSPADEFASRSTPARPSIEAPTEARSDGMRATEISEALAPAPASEPGPAAGSHVEAAPGPRWSGDRWSTATPEWQEREAATRARARRSVPVSMIRTLISLGVFGFVGIGLLVSALDGNAPVHDIAVGECFVVGDAIEVDELPVVDCAEEHDAELFARVTITGFGSGYPGDDPVFDWLYDQCLDRFPAYVGEPYESSEFWIDMFIPTTDGWDDGERTGLCTAVMVDDDLNVRAHTRTARSSGTGA